MKRILYLFSILLISTILAACGNTDSNNDEMDNGTNNENVDTETAEDNTGTTNDDQANDEQANTDDSEMKEKMDELEYTDFELEVDYGQDVEYEAEIEQKNDMVKADLDDDRNGEDLDGQAAFDKIYPLVQQLTIQKDTPKEDAIAEVLDVFDLEDDYEKFELEIVFSDGVKTEFEDRK